MGLQSYSFAIYGVGDQSGLRETPSQTNKKKCNFQNTVENKKLTAGKRQVQTDFDVFQREEVQYLDIETNVKGRKEQSFHCSSWKLCLQMKGMCLS